MSLTETQHTGEFILAEPEPLLSREVVTVTVPTGRKLQSGHVLGKLSATSKRVPYDNAGTDGSESAESILYTECDNTDGVAPVDFTATIIARLAVVRKDDLKWEAALEAADKTAAYADLAANHVIARD